MPFEFGRDGVIRLFTPQEASKLLSDVKLRVKEIRDRKKAADSLKAEIERFGLLGFDVPEVKEKNRELDIMIKDLMRRICELEDLGLMIRDIDVGLIDFPAERFGEKVFLCWKYGESDIEYWHSANEGFSGRKLLNVTVSAP
ncbi:MAG: DUF2203 domain-containing protein [Thaumarchaeota archaeon]|nr:DUF2203 domain-containing protein [Nitrososphaerota archaeon]MCS4539331.1 DUF2203 domain-containing protein [Nitrososphaerota archaeon]